MQQLFKPGVVASRLACRRGGRRVFSELSLQLAAGEGLWLRGPNGCGKTSLLRILAGVSRPDEGSFRIEGPDGDPRYRAAYVGHSNALNDHLTVAEALSFLCSLRGAAPTRQQMARALAGFGLSPHLDTPVRRLSQGQRRKVALSRLWLDEAALWLLDEPYDALDAEGMGVLNAALAAHLARGGCLVLTSHQAVALQGLSSFELAAGRPA